MEYKNLFSLIHRSQEAASLVTQLRSAGQKFEFSKADLAEAWTSLEVALKRNQKGRSLSLVRVILLLSGADKVIARIRREGKFRPSKYNFFAPAVQYVVEDLIENAAGYQVSDQDLGYLTSVRSLLVLASALKNLRMSLVSRMRKSRDHAVKTLLANIDIIFTNGVSGDWLADTDSVYAYSSESMAEAFSYLLRLFDAEIGLKPEYLNFVDESCVYSPFYRDLLVDAAKICEYLEAEVLIDAFPYRAQILERGDVSVSAEDPLLEKSIRVGYVQAEMQKQLRIATFANELANENGAIQSVTRLAEHCFTSLGERIVTYVKQPRPRYVAMWPMDSRLFEPFSANRLFLEDMASLEMLGTEDYVDPSTIVNSPVVGSITVIDILKVQRFFHFLSFGIYLAAENHSPTYQRPSIRLSSCLPVFERRNMLTYLSGIVGEDKAAEILNVLTCDLSADYVDLQYTPFVRVGNWYVISIAVLISSNLVRNVLCHHSQRLTMRGEESMDPMQAALRDALANAGFQVEAEVELGPKGNTLETDIVAYRDGNLFLFECKNSFHPCNVYEMRTSYDHVIYAAHQLTKRVAWLEDRSNLVRAFQKIGWDVPETVSVHSCVAIGNRVFNGYECEGHPVRQVHEMLNIISAGTVRINGVLRRVWGGWEFSTNDLLQYLEGTTVTADFMESARPLNRHLKFGSVGLSKSSYMLDTEHLAALGAARYPAVEEATT